MRLPASAGSFESKNIDENAPSLVLIDEERIDAVVIIGTDSEEVFE